MEKELEIIELPSSQQVKLSQEAYEAYYANFGEDTLFVFDDCISAGVQFPRIVRMIFMCISLLAGGTNWHDILVSNVVPGVVATAIWYIFRLYKIPGLCLITSIISGDIMRIYLHYLPLCIVCLFLLHNWRIFLFCILSSLIARGACAIVRSLLATAKYNDAVAKHVSET